MAKRVSVTLTVPDDVTKYDAALAIDHALGGALHGLGWDPAGDRE